jgi:hypothetical protein
VNTVVVGAAGTSAVGVPFSVTVDANVVADTNVSGAVNTDVTTTLTGPADCTIPAPVTQQDLAVLTVNTAITQVSFSVTCTQPSFHAFSASVTAVLDDTDYAAEVVTANNNGNGARAAMPSRRRPDLKIVSQTLGGFRPTVDLPGLPSKAACPATRPNTTGTAPSPG